MPTLYAIICVNFFFLCVGKVVITLIISSSKLLYKYLGTPTERVMALREKEGEKGK